MQLAFKSSVKKMSKKASRKKLAAGKKAGGDRFDADFKPFIIKPIPTPNKKPLIGNTTHSNSIIL